MKGGIVINRIDVLNSVLEKEQTIIEKSVEYQNSSYTSSELNQKQISDFAKYLDTFSYDEIMMLRAIMLIGREYLFSTEGNFDNLDGMLKTYTDSIDYGDEKFVLIDYILEKGLKISDYFNKGFKMIKSF